MTNIIVVRALGARGPQGPSGATSGFNTSLVSYKFEQQSAVNIWNIIHNLNFNPNITVLDYSGNTIECDISHVSANQVRLTFSSVVSGYAYLS
jgi:hypothetical protein